MHSKKCPSQPGKAKRDYYLTTDLVTIIIIIIITDHFVVIVMVIAFVTHKKQRDVQENSCRFRIKYEVTAVLHFVNSNVRKSNGINFPPFLFFLLDRITPTPPKGELITIYNIYRSLYCS